MFKGFQNTSRNNGFNSFPSLNFQMNNEAYGFSGIINWFDAAINTNTNIDGTAISSWKTKIGNTLFTQSTAGNQPTYRSTDANFNNLPSIDFTTSARWMSSANSEIDVSKTTIFIVYKANSISSGIQTLLGYNGGRYPALNLGGSDGNMKGFGWLRTNIVYDINATNNDTNPAIAILSGGNGNARIILNGVQVATASVNLTSNQLNYISATDFSQGLVARIAEFGFYRYPLNESQCVQLSDRLNSKYAIY